MNLKKPILYRVPWQIWGDLRAADGGGFSEEKKGCSYGLIDNPLRYKNFSSIFFDLSLNDQWLDKLIIDRDENSAVFDSLELRLALENKSSNVGKRILILLERADKITLGVKPIECSKSSGYIHFRRNCFTVYSGSFRIPKPQLDLFTYRGFNRNNIEGIKADYFPGYAESITGSN